jgi:hypothetical protein
MWRMKTHDMVSDRIQRRRYFCDVTLFEFVAFGEPSHGPCVTRTVVTIVVGYYRLTSFNLIIWMCTSSLTRIARDIELLQRLECT